MNTNDSMTAPRSRFTYAECVDAYGLFWQGRLSDDLEWAEVHAVLNGKMLAADDDANFTLPQGPTSLEIFNRGY
jgi:hypothetical protein